MLEVVATAFLLGAAAAFAVCAVLLNEGDQARRRRRRAVDAPADCDAVPPLGRTASERGGIDGVAADGGGFLEAQPVGERRLPVGDFLFGALYLREGEPLPFAELAETAARSGMSVAQVLSWIEQAEDGGLIERVGGAEPGVEPALRLTEAGIDFARNDRRRGVRAGNAGADDAVRTTRS